MCVVDSYYHYHYDTERIAANPARRKKLAVNELGDFWSAPGSAPQKFKIEFKIKEKTNEA